PVCLSLLRRAGPCAAAGAGQADREARHRRARSLRAGRAMDGARGHVRARTADRAGPVLSQRSRCMNQFLFGIYPYVALAVFLLGSLIRYDREQYTWKSDSSELLRRGQLRWGSNLFHLGILGIFFGHLFGLLTPLSVWHALGLEPAAKQMVAMVAGGIAGFACLAGLLLL